MDFNVKFSSLSVTAEVSNSIHCQQNPVTPFCSFNHGKKGLISKEIVCCVGGKVKQKLGISNRLIRAKLPLQDEVLS